jgi:hypothetical protein
MNSFAANFPINFHPAPAGELRQDMTKSQQIKDMLTMLVQSSDAEKQKSETVYLALPVEKWDELVKLQKVSTVRSLLTSQVTSIICISTDALFPLILQYLLSFKTGMCYFNTDY